MATFAGTTQKCKACEKTIYLVDQLTADNKVYHKACFRCHHCKGTLMLSNYCSFEGSYQQQSFELIYWNSRQMCCLQENSLPNEVDDGVERMAVWINFVSQI
ncbi:hypothetical protein CsSME_00029211 [Camellia sinensis var. sinensis]